MKLREDAHLLERELVKSREMDAVTRYSSTEVAEVLFKAHADRTKSQESLLVDEENMTAMQYLLRDNKSIILVIFLLSYLPESLFFNDHVGYPALLELAVDHKARLAILEAARPELILLHWTRRLAQTTNREHASRFNSRITWIVALKNPVRITHKHMTTIHPTGESVLSMLFQCQRLSPTCAKYVLAITSHELLQARHTINGATLLHLAATICTEPVIKHLLDRLLLGTIRATLINTGDTALHLAVRLGAVDVCRLILTCDIRVAEIKNLYGYTALDLCDAEMLEAILRK